MKKRALAVLLAFSMLLYNTTYLYAAEKEETPSAGQEAVLEGDEEQADLESRNDAVDEKSIQVIQEEMPDSSESEEDLSKAETEEGIIQDLMPIEGKIETFIPGVKDGQEPDDLFSVYVDRAFGGSPLTFRKATKGTGSRLTGVDAAVYAKIAGALPAIAAGEQASTIFTVSAEEIGLDQTSWTAEELGVASLIADGAIAEDAIAEVYSKTDYDMNLIINCLLADYPYHLYWYEKTQDTTFSQFGLYVEYSYEKDDYIIGIEGNLEFCFPVAEEFSAGPYMVDTSIGQSVQTSVQNAQEIVSTYSGASYNEKLLGYKNEICSMVSYNHKAAEGGVSYGNPWQMIWVFDGDPETNVVCEGYAKAFKYLCDQSSFDGNVTCITVSGMMDGGTGAGPHMWNIVSMDDGYNYLVDVTNCDEGTVGAPDLLFLALSASGDAENGYVFSCGSRSISYTYDEETIQIYTENEIVIGERTGEDDETASAQIVAASVNFKGTIGLNYYIDIPEEFLADSGAYIEYTIDKLTPETSRAMISELPSSEVQGRVCRKLTVDTVVKSINDKVTLHICDGEGNKLGLLSAGGDDITEAGFVYSVGGYCDDVEAQSTNAKMKDLAYKLKQYGLYVQKYLGYKADGANPALDVSGVTAETLEPFKGHRTDAVEGLTFAGFSFLFKEESAIRYRFRLSEGRSIDEYAFSVDGTSVTPSLSGSQYVIEVGNIRARDLGKEYAVEITDQNGNTQTLSYSGLSYAKALIEQGSTQEAKNAAKALYLYYDAAITYFGL